MINAYFNDYTLLYNCSGIGRPDLCSTIVCYYTCTNRFSQVVCLVDALYREVAFTLSVLPLAV